MSLVLRAGLDRFVHRLAVLWLACGLWGCGEPPLEPRGPTPGVAHFKIATYNVEFRSHDDPGTVEAIGASDADIVCLQEISARWETVLRERYAAEYPHMLFWPDGGTSGLGVLSRRQLVDGEVHLPQNDWHPAWTVLAETPAGWISVLNVHLRSLSAGTGGIVSDYADWGADHRFEIESFLSASEKVMVMPEQLPRIVLGDFNEGPDGDALRYLESLGFRNALPLFRPGQFTWRHPSLGSQFNQTLDHVLFDSFMEPLNAYTLNRGKSDHLPVVVHLEAAGPWPEFTPR